MKKILLSALVASTLGMGAFAGEAPVVGGSVVDVSVTSIYATGYRATKLIKAHVYNDAGDKIGNVEDLIVGGDSSVSFAILSVGGFLGIGSKLIAVPTIKFTTNEKGKFVLSGATKDSLKGYPSFSYAK